ncbi:hypothetical protein HELRODRAFT_177449 [Helobdella robusta]|uniref:PiggyBac transposable element-derived protein domain-containing protein n=1 Tax=Helobdella robusta TaxID=6412 RepID=T1FBQ4_HELRO|nr:hypothetical protein HELRODRAFT_177449 [Helobdella robusta]ESN97825.1 hypothetical protein HELRODRAFT_177449 [Helobdella robusta]
MFMEGFLFCMKIDSAIFRYTVNEVLSMLEDETFLNDDVILLPPSGNCSDEDSGHEESTNADNLSAQQLTAPADFRINYEDDIVDSVDKLFKDDVLLSAEIPELIKSEWVRRNLPDKDFGSKPFERKLNINLTPTQLFNAFFDDSVINFIKDMTELYTRRDKGKHNFSTTLEEICIFFAMLLCQILLSIFNEYSEGYIAEKVHVGIISNGLALFAHWVGLRVGKSLHISHVGESYANISSIQERPPAKQLNDFTPAQLEKKHQISIKKKTSSKKIEKTNFKSINANNSVIQSSNGKSCSLDPLPTFLLKEQLDLLLPFLCHLVNSSIHMSIMPRSQKTAIERLINSFKLTGSKIH